MIEKLNKVIESKDETIASKVEEFATLVAEKDQELANKDREIEILKKTIAKKDTQITSLKASGAAHEHH